MNSTSNSRNAGYLGGKGGGHRPQVQTQGPRYNVTVTAPTPLSREDPYGNLVWTPTQGDSDEEEDDDEDGAAAFGAALAGGSMPLYEPPVPRWGGRGPHSGFNNSATWETAMMYAQR